MAAKTQSSIRQSTLGFFNTKLTQLNNQRFHVNRSKGVAKYLASAYPNPRSLTPLDNTMGVMSFTLYLTRFSVNMALLAEMMCTNSCENNDKNRRDVSYRLWNDGLWGAVNLIQFFWLSFKRSKCAGLYGLGLDVLTQFIDILVMVLRFYELKEEYKSNYMRASEPEKKRLAIEWQNKEFNFIRSLLTALALALTLGLFAFSMGSVPLSPILASIVLFSSIVQLVLDWYRDKLLTQQMSAEGGGVAQIAKKERLLTGKRLEELNQIVLNHVLIPLGLFLFITSPFSLFLTVVLAMALLSYGVSGWLECSYGDNEVLASPMPGIA